MRLYLSSFHLGNNTDELKALFSKNKKAAIIQNALDGFTDVSRRAKDLEWEMSDLGSVGLDPEELY